MYLGTAYYPEMWPEERWTIDAELMQEAGITLVRLGEFAWSKFEPEEGIFNFTWMDRAIQVLAEKNISVVMCTPTAAPPKWLMDRHPDIYKEDENGNRMGFGSRRHYCYNNENFRRRTIEIVSAMAEHYGNNPSVVAWQTDNEYTLGDGLYCYCENCRQKFISWLKDKYCSLDKLNQEWGTTFWSQTYTAWDQIIVPKRAAAAFGFECGHNPGLLLDFARFQSAAVVAYNRVQCECIREYCALPITHNMVKEQYDYCSLAQDLNFVGYDNYPGIPWVNEWNGYKPADSAFGVEINRGILDKNIWNLEQQSGPVGWGCMGNNPRPGETVKWAVQSLAHGAETILFFRWRTCPYGVEQYWHGILDYHGKPGRRYYEIKKLGKDFPQIAGYIEGSEKDADIMLLFSNEQQWCHQIQRHNRNFDYAKYVRSLYGALFINNYQVNIGFEISDFSRYKVIIAPAFSIVRDDMLRKFEEYVGNGGTLIFTFRSGIKTESNAMVQDVFPGKLKELCGLTIEEYDSLNSDSRKVAGIFGSGCATMWTDILTLNTADSLADYVNGPYAGQSAISCNSYGKGKVYYIGCDLDLDAQEKCLADIACAAGCYPALENMPRGVEVTKKISENGQTFYVIINDSNHGQQINLPFEAVDCINLSVLGKGFTLHEQEYRIVKAN